MKIKARVLAYNELRIGSGRIFDKIPTVGSERPEKKTAPRHGLLGK